MAHNGYRHILKNIGLFGMVQGLTIFVALIRNKVIALLLGPMGIGLLSLYNATVSFLSGATSLGIGTSGVKMLSEHRADSSQNALAEYVNVIRIWSILSALFGMVLCTAGAPIISKWCFSDTSHTTECMLIGPIVGLTALDSCEMAILKGLQQLRQIARISLMNVVCVLVFTIPLYYFWGVSAIVSSLFLAVLMQYLLTLRHTSALYPLSTLHISKAAVVKGLPMIRLGLSFIIAGVIGSGAEFVIRSYLSKNASLDILGYYNAAYMMTFTYGGIVFSAMETDYFPRLSAIQHIGRQLNATVNAQIEVSLLIVAPLCAFFLSLMPFALPVLYSSHFLYALIMVQPMLISLLFRSIYLPIAYLPLTRTHAVCYMVMEGVSAISLVVCLYIGYQKWYLSGIGIGVSAAAFFEMVCQIIVMYWKYDYKLSGRIIGYFFLFAPLIAILVTATILLHGWLYLVVTMFLCFVIILLSVYLLRRQSQGTVNYLQLFGKK